jgi:hypothetical protein
MRIKMHVFRALPVYKEINRDMMFCGGLITDAQGVLNVRSEVSSD